MIDIKLFKMETSGWICDNLDCAHNEDYHYNILSRVFHIKQGTTCLAIRINGGREIYCRDCIDVIYKKIKPILDSKLWVLT